MSLFGLNTGYSLKDLLENPILQNPPQIRKDGTIKSKEKGDISPGFDPTSAFLGPNLWNSSQYATESDISLEYMDLDEFLSENGIPVDISENSNNSAENDVPTQAKSPVQSEPGTPIVSSSVSPSPDIPSSPQPESDDTKKEDVCGIEYNVTEQEVALATIPVEENKEQKSPDLRVDFEIGEGEKALVNVPGEESFDPKARKFSEDELKPQPMIKKSRKVFVPDEQKDDKYWHRRKKNNVAAKRSRDARRVKENQIAMRACFLEKCNQTLTEEVQKLKKENAQLKKSLEDCEKKLKNV